VTRLIVWRHGNTDWNAGHRVQGQTDVALNALGRQQAVDAAELLIKMRPGVIVSSDLQRASDTAAALAALSGLPVSYDKRLRERFFGAWQGLTMTEVAVRHPVQFARWTAGSDVGDPPAEIGQRLDVAARQGIGHLLGWPPEQLRTLRALQNCHWAELTRDTTRGWQLAAYNVGSFADRPVPPPV
jgi:broad specificity phosphatase PhoE